MGVQSQALSSRGNQTQFEHERECPLFEAYDAFAL